MRSFNHKPVNGLGISVGERLGIGLKAAARPWRVESSRNFLVRQFPGYFFHDWVISVQKLLNADLRLCLYF